jgi:hypothetical protein
MIEYYSNLWFNNDMTIVKDSIGLNELQEMSAKMFGNLVKAVVDIEKNIMAVDAELHADEEAVLIENGSKQKDLWGINLYPELFNSGDFVEFDSMINIRPSQDNRSRYVDDPKIRERIIKLVLKLVR